MNGISLVISKACCPVYSFGTNNKINFGTSRKINLIPCRLPNLHRQRISPFEATKPMLKHRVYSSSTFKDGSGYEVPEVCSAAVPYVLLTTVTIGMALLKTWEAVGQIISTKGSNACTYIILGVAAVIVARVFLGNIMSGFEVVRNYKSFEPGDLLQVGELKGRLLNMGVLTTSLLTFGDLVTVPTSWLNGQEIQNQSKDPTYPIPFQITFNIDKIEKIEEISEEIINLMRSDSIIHMDEEQPFCYIHEVEPRSLKLRIGCNLKQVTVKEMCLKENYICEQSIKIAKKHGATLGERVSE